MIQPKDSFLGWIMTTRWLWLCKLLALYMDQYKIGLSTLPLILKEGAYEAVGALHVIHMVYVTSI